MSATNERFERIFPIAVFAFTALVFLPLIAWLQAQAAQHEQLLHALIVFAFTGFLLVFQQRIPLKPQFQFSTTVQNLLLAGYALLVIAVLTRLSVLTLAALTLCLGAFLLYVFGSQRRRFLFSALIAFCGFSVFAAYMPYLDWPLRTIAGQAAAAGLALFGTEASLGLYHGGSEPMLLLFHAGRPYHVAAECNGFGLLISSLLMASLIVFYRRLPLFDRALAFAFAIGLGFAFNALRIVVIVLLAPRIPDDAYMLMHEIVGLAATYGGLAILYFLLIGKQSPALREAPPEQGAGVSNPAP